MFKRRITIATKVCVSCSHPGDWGNLHLEEDGTVVASFKDKDASLFGPQSLLGRGIVVRHLNTKDQ